MFVRYEAINLGGFNKPTLGISKLSTKKISAQTLAAMSEAVRNTQRSVC